MPGQKYVGLQIIKCVTWVTDTPVELLETNLLQIGCPTFAQYDSKNEMSK